MIFLKDGSVITEEEAFQRFAITFPQSQATLSDDHIEEFGLKRGLKKFAKALAAQYDENVEGVSILTVGVVFLKSKVKSIRR